MTSILTSIRNWAASSLPSLQLTVLDEVKVVQVQAAALREIADFLDSQSWVSVLLVVDANTYNAAGRQLERLLLEAGIRTQVTQLLPDRKGDVIADEASLIQALLDIQQSGSQVVLAVGGGTIHDISRYAAYTTGIPFVSVPTAASVDGFTSRGAPIIVRGEKKTIPAIGPSAIFADVDILMQAPTELTAAGFGDILGKHTSLFDWMFGHLAAEEPHLQIAADMTAAALRDCVQAVDQIAGRSEEGIRILMEALIQSGLAMLLFGQSHPASGSEHHLSHYWEMEYIRQGEKQLLHGAKVGAASVEIAKLYHHIGENGLIHTADHADVQRPYSERIARHWDVIRRNIAAIPPPSELSDLMRIAGGPASVSELSIGDELLNRSLREAHKVRFNRYTLLHAYNVGDIRLRKS
ncbi:sn-glycerol-1-phosphate dehydrogenase [Paenibacillus sp. JCM 10914]|uniref:sn-glycerol-1-phosphate dehydrogenase n=1 Tax=Paenibacillus sp. JCM 10914 TaxID=1236974 RepID=UPI0003CCA75B|nr:sn-glycerol-1-phosphate dehydrogenase [Paenibacillus sp. JCM 10914]GAE07730.1 NAD(P)H dehydrogenase [Paenibacillus sp. JCM 10914]